MSRLYATKWSQGVEYSVRRRRSVMYGQNSVSANLPRILGEGAGAGEVELYIYICSLLLLDIYSLTILLIICPYPPKRLHQSDDKMLHL